MLQPFRDLGPRLLDTVGSVQPGELGAIAGEPKDPVPGIEYAGTLESFDSHTIRALLSIVGAGIDSPLLAVQIRHLGGALARSHDRDGARGAFRETYQYFSGGIPFSAEIAGDIIESLDMLATVMSPWAGGAASLNFTKGTDVGRSFDRRTLARLQRIKRHRDPLGVIRSNKPVLWATIPESGLEAAG
jgi:hypothetical protein